MKLLYLISGFSAVLVWKATAFVPPPPSPPSKQFSSFQTTRTRLEGFKRMQLGASIPSRESNSDSVSTESLSDVSSSSSDELMGVGVWVVAMSAFLLVNNFVGPWPPSLASWWPMPVWLLLHALSGMMFSGGVILTTLMEWLVVDFASNHNNESNTDSSSDNSQSTNDESILAVLHFWFQNVPTLDVAVVLPALTLAIFSGTGLACTNYESLGNAPIHVKGSLHALLSFALWWVATDLTTQGPAKEALISLEKRQQQQHTKDATGNVSEMQVPRVLLLRRVSNVVSCAFVVGIYAMMILKPRFE